MILLNEWFKDLSDCPEYSRLPKPNSSESKNWFILDSTPIPTILNKIHCYIVTEEYNYSELERGGTEMTNPFSFLLQFGNNNNYMNMADANGALLAGDVSTLFQITFTFLWMDGKPLLVHAMSSIILESLNSLFHV